MLIHFNQDRQQFHLSNGRLSYIMEIQFEKYLIHVYNGKAITNFLSTRPYPTGGRSSFSPNPPQWNDREFSLDIWPQEYSGIDSGDYRECAYEMVFPDGTNTSSLVYKSHEIHTGKPIIEGLPATYVEDEREAETLVITLHDVNRQIEADLVYTIFKDLDIVTRSVTFRNLSESAVYLKRAMSLALDFDSSDFDMLQLPGTWAKEKQIVREPVVYGIQTLDSKRGASSSAQQPFIALLDKTATEFSGEVHGFHLIYSGNFKLTVEKDIFGQLRVLGGINDHQFSWKLNLDEPFNTPEMVYVFSDKGLNGMSKNLHKLYQSRLARGKYRDEIRPVLTNNWETTYFDFDEQKLLDLSNKASELGVELFVLDDGWFGKRNSDTTSLGDWFVDKTKLPDGLKSLSDKIHQQKMKFGLWFEPEMISEESNLFQKHPDWHIHVPGQPYSLARNQLVLNLAKTEVQEYILERLRSILTDVPIDYIKWDFNRNLTEIGTETLPIDQQMETNHRYILGLYKILETITSEFPDILFENCSGGGGRFDPGMCFYMNQSWTSDNTDAVERLKIQYGTSLLFPQVMICAQISEAPNHQVGRTTSIDMRTDVASSVNMGVMLDYNNAASKELLVVADKISWYKKHRQLIQFGEFYRLVSPFETNYCSWLIVDENKEQALLYFYQILGNVSHPNIRVKLVGLEAGSIYLINETCYTGSELMNYGLFLNQHLHGDFQSLILEIRKV